MIIDGEKYCCSFSEKLRLGNMVSICFSNLLKSEFKYTYKCYPLDTGRKLNVHKTFRRRPGRTLNVLCTFNLRPVTKGYAYKKNMCLICYKLIWSPLSSKEVGKNKPLLVTVR